MSIHSFLAELKRRHVYRVAAAYAVVAWLLLQLVNTIAPLMRLPEWSGSFFLVVLIVGFPISLVFAWIHDLKAPESTAAQGAGKLDWALMAALVAVLAGVSYQQLSPPQASRPAQQTGVEAARQAAASPASGIAIAVLPFANMSGDAGQEFFSDGMTEEITTALAKIPDLRVVARESAFQFKGEKLDMRSVGQELGATHLIEGSVRKAGERVRITAQLIKADDGTHLWAESYDRDVKDVFAVQEEIARAITTSLRMPLGLKPGENLVNNRGIDPASYEQFLRAKALYNSRTSGTGRLLIDAASLLEQVVARNPSYAPAWARLALVYGASPNTDQLFLTGTAAEFRSVVEEYFQKGEVAARRAIQLDAGNADAYAALAEMLSVRGKFSAAEDLFKQALALDPNNPDALLRYSDQLAGVGRLKEALATIEQLRALDPLVSTNAGRHSALLWLNGKTEESLAVGATRDRSGGAGNVNLVEIYAALGRYDEAVEWLTKVNPSLFAPGQIEAALRLLRLAPAKSPQSETFPRLAYLNFVYLRVGVPERVLEQFERDAEVGYQTFFAQEHLWHPVYAPVRKLERFRTFVRNAGLVDYWKARGWPEFCHPTAGDDFICE